MRDPSLSWARTKSFMPWALPLLALSVGVALAACGNDAADIDSGADDTDGGTTSDDGGSANSSETGSGNQPGADGSTSGALDGGSTGSHDYGTDGPFTVTTKSEKASNGTSTFDVTVYIPSGKGPFPVVVLSSGLQQPALAYAPYAKRLASWGIATFTRDDPGALTSSSSIQKDVEGEVTSYLPTADSNLYDVTRVGLAGHSRGGQVSLLAAENGLVGKTKGLFLLDPVDDPNTSVKPGIGKLGVSLAMLGETTDSDGGIAGQNCAPAGNNYESIYQVASSPALAITAINADHVMFEDPTNCSFCGLCVKGTATPATVLAQAQRLMMTYFAKVLLGDTNVDAVLGTAGDVTAGTVTVESK